MTDTRKKWFKVGAVFGTVPDGVPSEKRGNKGEFRPNSGFYWSCHTYNFKGNWLAQG